MKHYKVILIHLIVCSLCSLLGCATSVSYRSSAEADAPSIKIVWPPPPQTARIQYLKTISSPADIGVTRTWLSKMIDSIFGKDDLKVILLRPYGISATADRLVVTDPGIHALHVFDIKDRKYFNISSVNGEDLLSPIGVAVDKNGDIYFSDSMLKKIFICDREGRYRSSIASAAFIRPAGISIDEDRIYVVDSHAHSVSVFSKKDSKFLFSFGRNGTYEGGFNYPTNIFIGKDKLLYITDSLNFRVQIFDRDGNFLGAFGKHGDGSGDFSKPKGIAVDSEGHIYVVDADFDIVQIFDRSGALLLAFGNSGVRTGELFLPSGIFINENDNIYVADSYNNRIQIFQYLKETKKDIIK